MVTKMISAIVEAISGLLTGIGTTTVEFFDGVVVGAEGELTTFAVWALAFLGIGFAFGAVKYLMGLIRR